MKHHTIKTNTNFIVIPISLNKSGCSHGMFLFRILIYVFVLHSLYHKSISILWKNIVSAYRVVYIQY